MRAQDLSIAEWRKSSYSSGVSDNCVEVATNVPGVLPVRDSKVPDGPVLVFSTDAWTRFVATLKL
ncbi:DUF397 domain-containing protein [Streptomyces sclerotialus]|uniref:DUF397 domain-containing protein n=1 Tax=Streptomyces sclerotialus TaxID=1957 RepID=UPI0004C6057D